MNNHVIVLGDYTIPYTLNTSLKLKRLTMRWTPKGELIINKPSSISENVVTAFLFSKATWIIKHHHRFLEKKSHPDFSNHSREHFLQRKTDAYQLATSKVEQWSAIIPYAYNTIRVKQLKTKRGSCSSKRNLNFNYKILFLPESLQDYLVVHEMCHLQEMNHSHRFWGLVDRYYGPYHEARKSLKSI